MYNAFRPQTNTEILDALAYCRECSDVRVIVLTGAGDKAFCSGGDQHYKTRGGYSDQAGIPRLNVLDIHRVIRSIPKPVIAMVNGYAIGGGNVLNVVCDLSIAGRKALYTSGRLIVILAIPSNCSKRISVYSLMVVQLRMV